MRYFLLLIGIHCIFPVFSQRLYPEVMEKRECLLAPVYERAYYSFVSTPSFLPSYQCLPYDFISNASVRYAIQNLYVENTSDDEAEQAAVRSLLRYAKNEYLQNSIEYLKGYARRYIPKQEKALSDLQKYATEDSLYTDLQVLLQYIQQDSNFMWLRHAAKDSVQVELLSTTNTPITFWMNNGRMSFYRFWAGNKQCDTIGTWVQVMPRGNQLKIYVDEDVRQIPLLDNIQAQEKAPITNQPGNTYYTLDPGRVVALRRRYWTYYAEMEVAMSQGALVNWANGGENSLSLLSNVRYYLNYNRNKTSWESWLHYRFGFMKNGKEDMKKNEDRLEINSKVGQKAFKYWYYTAQFNLTTQLFSSYEYPEDQDRQLVANFMSPGDFTLSLGMDYKPKDNFSLMLSPIAGKWTLVRDSVRVSTDRYGITEAGKRFKREAGAQLYLNSKISGLAKIMDVTNELKLFMSYEKEGRYINKGQENEMRKHLPMTLNWKMTLYFKINYFLTASIYTETIYDESFSRKLQFKENLNLGVKFRF